MRALVVGGDLERAARARRVFSKISAISLPASRCFSVAGVLRRLQLGGEVEQEAELARR